MFFWWEFKLNQIDLLTLGCMVLSFVVWQRGRPAMAGFWIGLAVLLKITPGLLVVWYLLKRQYRTVAIAAATVILAGPVGTLVIFGPRDAADAYRAWFRNAVTLGSHGGIIRHQREVDWRNQGLGAVASRWLHETNWNTQFDNDPRAKSAAAPRYHNIANVDRDTLARLVTVVMAACLAALLWIWRRPAAQLSLWQLRYEFALGLVAMLFFMPVLRRYHLIWLLPALTMLGPALHVSRFRTPWAWLTLVVVFWLVAVQFALSQTWERGVEPDNHLPEAWGVLLLAVVGIALPLLLMLRRLVRDPQALPATSLPEPPPRAGAPASSDG